MKKRELLEIYREFLPDRVNKLESGIEKIPDELGTSGVWKILEEPLNKWKKNRKSLRTLPVVNVYNNVLDEKLSNSVVESLLCLDAWIGSMDDEIDTKNISKRDKIFNICNTAFSGGIGILNLPEGEKEGLRNLFFEYLTELFQIPNVEKKTLLAIKEAKSDVREVKFVRSFYSYRSIDIDLFAKIPGIVNDIDDKVFGTVVKDLEVFRARELILKDIVDVERDLKDEDFTALMVLMDKYDDFDKVIGEVEDVLNYFSYSDFSRGKYRKVLKKLEENKDYERDLEKGFNLVKKKGFEL